MCGPSVGTSGRSPAPWVPESSWATVGPLPKPSGALAKPEARGPEFDTGMRDPGFASAPKLASRRATASALADRPARNAALATRSFRPGGNL